MQRNVGGARRKSSRHEGRQEGRKEGEGKEGGEGGRVGEERKGRREGRGRGEETGGERGGDEKRRKLYFHFPLHLISSSFHLTIGKPNTQAALLTPNSLVCIPFHVCLS